MLAFFFEVILTVAAWRKGWRARALWPIAVAVTMTVLIRGAVELSGGSIERAAIVEVIFDVFCAGSLAWLAARGPESRSVD